MWDSWRTLRDSWRTLRVLWNRDPLWSPLGGLLVEWTTLKWGIFLQILCNFFACEWKYVTLVWDSWKTLKVPWNRDPLWSPLGGLLIEWTTLKRGQILQRLWNFLAWEWKYMTLLWDSWRTLRSLGTETPFWGPLDGLLVEGTILKRG
jgi:hypothetical protein